MAIGLERNRWKNMRKRSTIGGLALILSWLLIPSVMAQLRPPLDPELEPYLQVSGVSGDLRISGSETMKGMLRRWAMAFQDLYSLVKVSVTAAGSATAMPDLTTGTTQLAAMSRVMSKEELNMFTKRFGYPPSKVAVGIDALAVYVHRDNPIQGLTLSELDAIFSQSRKRGLPYSIDRWGQLRLKGPWLEAPIHLHGRDPLSGTATFLKEQVLEGGEFMDKVREQPGSATIVIEVAKDPYAIGYSGIGYRISGVRPVPLVVKPGDQFIEPSFQTAMDGTYPLHRHLSLYVNCPPHGGLSKLTMEFLRFVASKDGQSMVQQEGFFPLSARDLNDQIARLTISTKEPVSDRGNPDQ